MFTSFIIALISDWGENRVISTCLVIILTRFLIVCKIKTTFSKNVTWFFVKKKKQFRAGKCGRKMRELHNNKLRQFFNAGVAAILIKRDTRRSDAITPCYHSFAPGTFQWSMLSITPVISSTSRFVGVHKGWQTNENAHCISIVLASIARTMGIIEHAHYDHRVFKCERVIWE